MFINHFKLHHLVFKFFFLINLLINLLEPIYSLINLLFNSINQAVKLVINFVSFVL